MSPVERLVLGVLVCFKEFNIYLHFFIECRRFSKLSNTYAEDQFKYHGNKTIACDYFLVKIEILASSLWFIFYADHYMILTSTHYSWKSTEFVRIDLIGCHVIVLILIQLSISWYRNRSLCLLFSVNPERKKNKKNNKPSIWGCLFGCSFYKPNKDKCWGIRNYFLN